MNKLCVNHIIDYLKIAKESKEILLSEINKFENCNELEYKGRRIISPKTKFRTHRKNYSKLDKSFDFSIQNSNKTGRDYSTNIPLIHQPLILQGRKQQTDISLFIEKMQRFPKYYAQKGLNSFC